MAVNPAKFLADDFSGNWQQDLPDLLRLLNKSYGDITGAINTQILLKQLGAQTLTKTITVPDDWTTVSSYTNSWATFSASFTTKYRLTASGTYRMQGAIKSGVIGSAAFTLPKAAWPSQDQNLAVESNGAFGKLLIRASDGAVIPSVGSTTFFSLDSEWQPSSRAPYVPSCFPLRFESKLSGGTAGLVLIGSVVDKNVGGGQIVYPAFSSPAWHNETGLSSKGNTNYIVVDNISGLMPTHTYVVTLFALPEQ